MAEGLLDVDAAARFIGTTPKELQSLAANGVLPRQSGKFHPVQLVQGYIAHIKSEAEKGELLTQVDIARRLDMSERNLRDVLQVLKIDHRTTPFSDIAVAYIRDLREKAAGRGGEHQAALTMARIRKENTGADLNELQVVEKAGNLPDMDVVRDMQLAMITAARQELLSLPEKLVAEIKALYNVDVDSALIQEHIYESLNQLADDQSGSDDQNDAGGSSVVGATAQADHH